MEKTSQVSIRFRKIIVENFFKMLSFLSDKTHTEVFSKDLKLT